jgi:FkbM family methyltransferase
LIGRYLSVLVLKVELFLLYFLSKTTKTYRGLKFGDFDLRGFKRILPHKPLIIEIGANDGSTTKEFIEIFPESIIECYEPDKRAIVKFRKQNFPANVNLIESAVSDYVGKIALNESSKKDVEWSYSSTISVPKFHKVSHPSIYFNKTSIVDCINLDKILDSRKVNLLWMDTQGVEYLILKGTKIANLNLIDFIYLEYSIFRLYSHSKRLGKIRKLLPNHYIMQLNQNDVLFAKL